jgi:AraC-like DNA-binding protein
LFERFEISNFKSSLERESPYEFPRSLLDSLRTALRPHLHDSDLTVGRAAKLCGHDQRRLSRELRELGTSLSKQITQLRAEEASRQLVDTDHPVAEVAEAVGFTDPTVFSRAFKNWTGKSPRDYRRTQRSIE